MRRRPRLVWLTAILALTGAGMVRAQPAAPSPPTAQAAPSAPVAPAPRAAPEEAPPTIVTTPQPVATPPISEKEVAPVPSTPEPAPAPEGPQRRPRYDIAVLQALDKVTAETLRFEAQVGRPVRYKTLIFTVRACEHTAPDEPIDDSIAYVEVLSQPKAEPGHPVLPPKQAFKGWMFASSPSLDPLEHPVYDAWLISCRAATPAPAAPPAPAR
ncbi:MAG TPA: DUF2155 domain-containing protein [Phenylobacterium sp.]|jgi:hypothetical protein|nr:DUF2155 domain-containing protein [Phenylobacterium sp.]